jgi:hypothetical protein
MEVLPITREGGLLAKLRSMFGADAQIQEGDIRVEKVLTPSDVAQRFNLNGEGVSKRPLEVFIGLNDLVIPYALKVALNKVADTGVGNNGNADDLTYPDLSVFATAATPTAVSEADALKAIYSGAISMKANTIEVLNAMQLRRFYNVNQTQGSATTQPQLMENGFKDIIQPAIFSGRDTNIMEFQPAPGADVQQIGGTAPSQNILVFHFKCLVVRNGAQPATWTQVSEVLDKYTSNRVIL